MKDLKVGVHQNPLTTFKNLTPEYQSMSKVKNHQQGVRHPSNIVPKPEPRLNSNIDVRTRSFVPVERELRETYCETLYHNKKQTISDLLNNFTRYKHLKVNSQYISKPIQKYLPSNRNLLIKSDMGTGKTVAMIDLIAQQPSNHISIFVNHLCALVEGTNNRINEGLTTEALNNQLKAKGAHKYAVSYDGIKENTLFGASAVVTTVNSLHKILTLLESTGQKIHALIIDESESVAQFMVSKALSNASEVGQCLTNLEQRANHILLMDAHLGIHTLAFVRAYLPNTPFTLLENTFTRWEAFTYEWACNNEAKGLALIEQLLEQGKKLFITATSRERAESIEAKLRARGSLDGLKVLKGFNDKDKEEQDRAELKAAKANNALFLQYDVVIASPNIGTGVSIETPHGTAPHFDCVVSFMVRHKDTPDALGALQMPFRVRDTKDRHLYLVALDFASQGKPSTEWQVRKNLENAQAQYELLINNNVPNELLNQFLKYELSKYSTYEAALDIEKERSFNEYFEDIDRILKEKGIKLRQTVAELHAIDTKELNKQLKQAKKQRHLKALIEAKPLDEKQLAAIEFKKRLGEHVTKADLIALEKQSLLRDYHGTEVEPTPEQLETYLKYKEDGLRTGRNNIANGLMTLRQVRLVEKAILLDENYKRDITQKAHIQTRSNWELDRVLCDLVGIEINENKQLYEFKNKKLIIDKKTITNKENGHSINRRITDSLDNFNAANPEKRINRKQLEDNSLETIIKLVEKRLKIKFKKLENESAYELKQEQPVLDALNIAIKRGVFGLARLANASELKSVLDQEGQLNQDTCKRLGIDSEIKGFISKVFEQLPARKHKQVLVKYIAIAESPRLEGDNFAPIAHANHYLHEVLSLKAA